LTKGYSINEVPQSPRGGGGAFFIGLNRERQDAVSLTNLASDGEAMTAHGFRPDYGSGPYMALVAAAVGLARRDMSNPLYSVECRSFLTGDLVGLFAECLGYEGSFLNAKRD
jgi:hypothetical protein